MEKPYEIINNQRVFNFKKTLRYLQYLGKSKYGEEFKIHRSDVKTFHRLIIYMIHEDRQCEKYNIDLKKGILLIGPIGSGKTTIMSLLRVFLFKQQLYTIKSSRDIALEYQRDGVDVINKYGKKHQPLFIDDLGVENTSKFYGNECNTIGEILLQRYELLTNYQIVTHATTNLNADELEQLYGNRVRSRLRTMFNLITFPTTTKDKRK
jgi:DNA replication protein DnaC